MPKAGSKLEELRRAEADAKKEWEQAVQAVRLANEAMQTAHQKYLQVWKALSEVTVRSSRDRALSAKAS